MSAENWLCCVWVIVFFNLCNLGSWTSWPVHLLGVLFQTFLSATHTFTYFQMLSKLFLLFILLAHGARLGLLWYINYLIIYWLWVCYVSVCSVWFHTISDCRGAETAAFSLLHIVHRGSNTTHQSCVWSLCWPWIHCGGLLLLHFLILNY